MLHAPKNAWSIVIPVRNILNIDIPSENPQSDEPFEIRYGGAQIRMKAGEVVPMSGDMAYHAAYKMAQIKIILESKLGVDFNPSSDKSYTGMPKLDRYMKEALGESIEASREAVRSPEEQLQAKLDVAKAQYEAGFQEPITGTEDTRTKAQLMKEVKAKGGKVNITMTKSDLLSLEATL